MTRADPPNRTPPTKSIDRRPEARCEVLWLTKAGGGTREVLADRPVRVGRASECDVRIDDPSVSRAHVILHPGDPWEVEDLGSHNGTRVGGRKLAKGERAPMPVGLAVSVGEAVLIVHRADVSAEAADSAVDVGIHEEMKRVDRLVELAAKSDVSIILAGETGVGKEVTAARVHQLSPRVDKPFVAVDCAALPDHLLESELFGYERGAFTGAVNPKPGLLETAAGGTVFLDEVGELPLATQPKLLRAFETHQVMRLGSLKPRPFDARFVAATNRDLPRMVARGEFRSDLYYRLNGITIVIPPLRLRLTELEPLSKQFVSEASVRLERRPPALTKAALDRLRAHAWPGNIRELRNVIDRAVMLSEGREIGPQHLELSTPHDASAPSARAPQGPPASSSTGLMDELVALERKRIVEALERSDGNQTVAARALGISRRTLVYRLGQLGLRQRRKPR